MSIIIIIIIINVKYSGMKHQLDQVIGYVNSKIKTQTLGKKTISLDQCPHTTEYDCSFNQEELLLLTRIEYIGRDIKHN